MGEWEISNEDIELTEKLLLPEGAQFPEDARNVIRCWHSTDVSACPGSGKTTVLIAKLKLLADRMPLEDGAGICVLSHTNVAVNEIKTKLPGDVDKLINYPNFFGTIQAFVDRFVTIPYLRSIVGRNVRAVDNTTYAKHMLNRIQNNTQYNALKERIVLGFKFANQYKSILEYVQALHLKNNGSLYLGKSTKALSVADKDPAKQFNELINDLLKHEGIMKYEDAYYYAKVALNDLLKEYPNFISKRFRYVFIDEYQDCDDNQRQIIEALFNPEKCTLIRIGDPDQAIYDYENKEMPDWEPREGFLSIMTSFRYNQEIADAICNLKKGNKSIGTFIGKTNIKPVLLVFDVDRIDKVLEKFIRLLDEYKLFDKNGIYKAIGAVKKNSSKHLTIGSYWLEFDGSIEKTKKHSYWGIIDRIITDLLDGKLYNAERLLRTLLCRILHYSGVRNPLSGKDYTLVTVKMMLDAEYREFYRQWVYELAKMHNVNRETMDCQIRKKVNELLNAMDPILENVFDYLPVFFLDNEASEIRKEKIEKNTYIDPIGGRKIVFDTIHGVKGETHDATLYLETFMSNATDLKRILSYYGVDNPGTSHLYDSNRKLAYVGMSRPKKLLCVAMQSDTYNKSKGVFDDEWNVIDLR